MTTPAGDKDMHKVDPETKRKKNSIFTLYTKRTVRKIEEFGLNIDPRQD